MKTKHYATKEEFNVIKEAITGILQLWQHPFIEGKNGENTAIAMSKETFFELLAKELNVDEN